MTEKALTIIQKIDSVAFNSKSRFMAALAQAMPRESIILAPALVRQALTIIKASESLQQCDEASLFNAIVEVGQVGLSLDLHLGQCYIVPFSRVATVMYGYRGLIELARRSGEVSEMVGEIRYSKDQFHITLGTNRGIHHIPADVPESKRGERLGAYAIATLRSGTVFEYMDADQILRIKNAVLKRKKTDKPSVWETENENEMWRKTPIRRLAKRVPQSPALIPFVQAAIRDEYRQQAIHQVVEMPPAITESLEAAGVETAPVHTEPVKRESQIKEKQSHARKTKPAAPASEPISKTQADQLYRLMADLNLAMVDVRKNMKEVGYDGPPLKFPAEKFADLLKAIAETKR